MTINIYREGVDLNQIFMEIQNFLDLEEKLKSLNEANYNEMLNFILNSNYMKNTNGVYKLIQCISVIALSDPKTKPLIQNILISLSDVIQKNVFSHDLYSIFHKTYDLMYFLIYKNILKLDETLISRICQYDYIFCYFSQLVKDRSPEIYQSKKDSYLYASAFIDKTTDFSPEKFYNCIPDDPLSIIIQNDNLQAFMDYITKNNIDINSSVKFSIYECNEFCNLFYIDQMPRLIDYAAIHGSINIFKYLLVEGAILSSEIPLFAIKGGKTEIISLLEENIEIRNHLISQKSLNRAILYHKNNIIDYIRGNYELKFGSDALLFSITSLNYKYIKEIINDNVAFDAEANHEVCTCINQRDDSGWTSLHWAVRNGCTEIVNFLSCFNNFDVNIADEKMCTPLHLACQFSRFDIIKILCNFPDININAKTEDGYTPIYYSCESGKDEIVQFLLEKFSNSILINEPDNKENETPILRAVQWGYRNIVKLLVKYPGIDLEVKDQEGFSIVHWAVDSIDIPMLELILELAPEIKLINDPNKSGNSPLVLAVFRKSIECIKLLSKFKYFDPKIRYRFGRRKVLLIFLFNCSSACY